MQKIKTVMLQVCSACQRNCTNCVTKIARSNFPGYQLSLESLNKFIGISEESDYFFEKVWINGFGDPLLWNNLKKGVKKLRSSKSVGKILIRSNGLNTSVINDDLLNTIDELSISRYKYNTKIIDKLLQKHNNKIKVLQPSRFIRLKGDSAKIPCSCSCWGPSIIGDWALLHCGPVIFSQDTTDRLIKANKISERDIESLNINNWAEYTRKFIGNENVVPVEKGFLDTILKCQTDELFSIRNMDACRYCFGNKNFVLSGNFEEFNV